MSVFGRIMKAIFGTSAAASPAGQTPTAGGASPSGSGAAPTAPQTSPTTSSAGAPPLQPSSSQPAGAQGSVDVAKVLDGLAGKSGEKLDWRHSIVDLMKLLDIDSSLSARKELAKELHYSGDTNDSATMNIWLHKQVMAKLEENGGKVPAELRD